MARLLDRLQEHEGPVRRFLLARQRDRLSATWLFVGPAGVGKRLAALGLIQSLVCDKHPEGCGQCGPCRRIEKGQSESLLLIEPQGTQIKAEQAREVLRFVGLETLGRARAVVIDQAEVLNAAAANALLKTLEEPPPNTYIFLITSSLSALLPTIRSRAQVMRFAALSPAAVEKLSGCSSWAAQACGGSLEQAHSLSSSERQEVRQKALNWLNLAFQRQALRVFGEVKNSLKDAEEALFIASMYQHWALDVARCRAGGRHFFHSDRCELIERGAQLGAEFIDRLWQSCRRLDADLRGHVDRTLCVENFLLDVQAVSCHPPVGAETNSAN